MTHLRKFTQKSIIEIEKQFSGLRITEFPLYVQGLEFRDDSENPENNDPRGVIISHERKGSTGNFKSYQKLKKYRIIILK